MKNHTFQLKTIIALCILYLISSQQIKAQCHTDDWTALKTLYESTDGDNWDDNTGWEQVTGATPPADCDLGGMYGVTVDGTGRVSGVDLYDNQLSGNIPPEIGSLSNVTYLNLSKNQLSESIPPGIGNLTNVTHLRLNSNQLIGNIPPEIGNLTNLTILNLSSNQLSGNIPPELGNLTKLIHLFISRNQFSGTIPVEIGNLTKLIRLYINRNQLTGSIPPEIGNLTNLDQLSFAENLLTGSIPPEIGNLNNLEQLSLYKNQLTGSIPPELGNLISVNLFQLYDNQLTGSIPSEIGNLEDLTKLYLFNNQLTGSIPPEIGNLSSLEFLWLYSNQLTGNIPPEIGNLSSLTSLDLSYNQFSGCYDSNLLSLCTQLSNNTNAVISDGNNFDASWESFCSFGNCTSSNNDCADINDWTALKALYESTDGDNWTNNTGWEQVMGAIPPTDCDLGSMYGVTLDGSGRVTRLYLYSNQLNGTIPPEIGNLSNLTDLYLNYNQLTGNIPPEIGNLNNLIDLHLHNNQLTGNIPPELGNMNNLEYCYLYNNQLSGIIPSELGNLASILQISFSDNQLTGSIPPELGSANTLEQLNLSSNQLTGNIPPELGNLANLINLDLSDNLLSGNIPPELTNIINIYTLRLSYNQLSGSIPPEFGNFTDIYTLNLTNNQLSGNIPPELGNLGWIGYLGLSSNQLTGSIPGELGNLTFDDYVDFHSNQLSGCYDANLSNWCAFSFIDNEAISNGNNFDASWESFCSFGNCDSDNNDCAHIDDWTALKALYESTDGDNWTNNTGWEQVTGTAPPTDCDLGSMYGVTLDGDGRVTRLSLYSNQLNGSLPPEIESLTELITLSFSTNQLMGNIPPEIGNLNNLEKLYLSSNQLTGNIPSEIGNLTSLKEFSLSQNQLTGSIPPEIGNLNSLKKLYLYSNQLTGSIPPEIGNLNNLEKFHAYSNQLTDIPPEIGNLSNLIELRLYNNQLTSIPPEIGNLISLTELDLSRNQLTGSIPPEIGNLSNLTILDISDNQLTGNIPAEIGNLSNLIELDLYYNQLSGEIPPEIGNLSNLMYLWIGSNQLVGCYDANLLSLCDQLIYASISSNNYLDTSWDDFCTNGIIACINHCPFNITLNDASIPDSIYQAQQAVTSSGQVTSGNDVVFKAGQIIKLDNDFTAYPGANFTAEIEDCSTDTFAIESLDGTNGFVINGINSYDHSGDVVSSAGDINGDGFDDIIIGAFGADPNGNADAGQSYVIFGKSTGFPSSLNVTDLNGTNGFIIDGISSYDRASQVNVAGDVNGDGLDDIIIGGYSAGANNAGESYVIFGKNSAFSSPLNLSTLNGSNGFTIKGISSGDGSGISVSVAGDVNGDDIDDFIIGAFNADPNGNLSAGESYVVFGNDSGFPASFYLNSLNGSNGFVIPGMDTNDYCGYIVSAAGDINADGTDDIIIGVPGGNANGMNGGESYVIYGNSNGFNSPFDPSGLDGTNGFVIHQLSFGTSAGDVNGDGMDDLIFINYDKGYIIYGDSNGFTSPFERSSIDGTNGFVVEGINIGTGDLVSHADGLGDVNGDGIDDMIIYMDWSLPANSQCYIIYGNSSGFSSPFDVDYMANNDGFMLNNVNGGGGDHVVSADGAGDVNGDGFDDIIIGAWAKNSVTGETYVIFGNSGF